MDDVELFFEVALDLLCIAGFDGYFRRLSPRWSQTLGWTDEELKARPFVEFVHPEDREATLAAAARLAEGRNVVSFENRYQCSDGSWRWISWNSFAVVERQLIMAAARDVTEHRDAMAELQRHRDHLGEMVQERTRELVRAQEISTRQARDLMDLSTPVMRVWEGVIVAPLIGTLDSRRTLQFMERVLHAIVDTRSEVALVDITGVPHVDTQTAQNLIETAQAVRLLGAQVVLTGVSPSIAHTLVHLGVDMSGIVTRSSLSAGLAHAFGRVGLRVVPAAGASQ